MLKFRAKTCTMLAALVMLAAGTGWSTAVSAEEAAKAPPVTAVLRGPPLSVAELEKRETWRLQMLAKPRALGVCYIGAYPNPAWQQVPCKAPPKHLYGPVHFSGPTTDLVGAGDDFLAEPAAAGTIALAEGSFDTVSGATSITTTGAVAGQGNNGPNLWTLQLNSNYFATELCNTPMLSVGNRCRGVAQYVYDNSSQQAIVQFWLATTDNLPLPGAPSSCPSGWGPTDGYCVITPGASASFTSTPMPADLQNIKLTGQGAGATVYWNGQMIATPAITPPIPDQASNWGTAEFNIFGDGGRGNAVFNPGVTVTVRTQVNSGHNLVPDCVPGGSTAETNSLNLVSTPTIVPMAPYPSIVFNEDNISSTPASCSTSVGDPHITTFDGLYYSFYASGDYVAADTGPDFVVQTRQESGAVVFNNPNVTMNTAVAVKLGSNRIAIYDSPQRVVVNGAATNVADNQIINLPGGVYLMRVGAVYAVGRNTGELVRAQLNNGWMDLTVGLGHRARSSAHGILASPARVGLSMRDGTVLKEPVSAEDLYQRYARSWLVQPDESLFAERPIKFAAPARLFTATDLEPEVYARAHAACVAAGVTDAAHLESCTLDTGVFKTTIAIGAFTHAIVPKLTIRPVELGGLKQ